MVTSLFSSMSEETRKAETPRLRVHFFKLMTVKRLFCVPLTLIISTFHTVNYQCLIVSVIRLNKILNMLKI